MSDFDLSEWQVIQDFGKHHNSKSVVLLRRVTNPSEIIVEKTYTTLSEMENEMTILRRIHGCSFVPEMVGVDQKAKKLYTTYQGKTIKAYTPELKEEVKKKLQILKTKYGISRPMPYPGHWGYPRVDNVCWQNGEIRLIDFGFPWVYHAPPPAPAPKKLATAVLAKSNAGATRSSAGTGKSSGASAVSKALQGIKTAEKASKGSHATTSPSKGSTKSANAGASGTSAKRNKCSKCGQVKKNRVAK